ncbi:MAG: DNA-3-methyladenine glycosylase [Myxococcota bacterium]
MTAGADSRAPLGRDFFARPCLEVAPELLGCLLVRTSRTGVRRVGRIVEVEAYLGDGSDPASHSHRGPTPRSQVMFGPPGRFYVYLSMGLHRCVNVVCEPAGRGAAILLRALEPLEGLEAMRRARGGRSDRELCNGPGKLAQAFGITLRDCGRSALRGSLRIATPLERVHARVLCGPRIGISRATARPYRFFLDDNPWVSRSPLNRKARARSR